MKYEYESIQTYRLFEITNIINRWVGDGWEFVQVVTEAINSANSANHLIIFRRSV